MQSHTHWLEKQLIDNDRFVSGISGILPQPAESMTVSHIVKKADDLQVRRSILMPEAVSKEEQGLQFPVGPPSSPTLDLLDSQGAEIWQIVKDKARKYCGNITCQSLPEELVQAACRKELQYPC